MSLDALRNNLLAARDARQALLDGIFPSACPATVMLSLNLPGAEKGGARAEKLFAWGEREFLGELQVTGTLRGSDPLGPFALYRTELAADEVKRLAITLESRHPAGRLLDLDVYDPEGRRLGRAELDLPPRSCLLCAKPALACIRAGRHSHEELALAAWAVIDAL